MEPVFLARQPGGDLRAPCPVLTSVRAFCKPKAVLKESVEDGAMQELDADGLASRIRGALSADGRSLDIASKKDVTLLAQALAAGHTIRTVRGSSVLDEGACALAETLKARGVGASGRVISLLPLNQADSSVTSVSLSNDNIGAAGSCAFAAMLEQNTTITSLDLSDNDINDEGALSLASALATNNVLLSLDLGHNQVGEAGALALAEVLANGNSTLKRLRSVFVVSCSVVVVVAAAAGAAAGRHSHAADRRVVYVNQAGLQRNPRCGFMLCIRSGART